MSEERIRAALRALWDIAGTDAEARHAIYHDDAVLEFPQSQERFVSKANFLAWRKQYPTTVEIRLRHLHHQGELWVAEMLIQYEDGPWQNGCSILEFRGDQIAKETIYVAPGWDAPEWRSAWRSTWEEAGATPTPQG